MHTCTVPPAPPPELEAGLPAEEAAEMRRVREAALQAAGGDLKKNVSPSSFSSCFCSALLWACGVRHACTMLCAWWCMRAM